ncbi:MAG TPA: hypothetical protein VIM22_09995 [Solirubrobacteraceae bacterium]
MHASSQTPLMRPDALAGQVVAVAGRAGGAGRATAAACGGLGARVEQLGEEGHRVDLLDEQAVGAAIAAIAALEARLDTVVIDSAGLFSVAVQDGLGPLRAAVDPAWVVARAAATRVMIEGQDGGKLIVLAPRPGAGPHAQATRDALENFARTLSIEWSRYAIRVTTVAPGAATGDAEVCALATYLASPAGDYFSGCVFSLGGP